MAPEDDEIESEIPLSDGIEGSNEEEDFIEDSEITSIYLGEKNKEDAKEKAIKMLIEELQTSELFSQARASARNLITSKQLAEAAIRYLREKYALTEEEIEELKEEAIRRYYQLRHPFIIQKKGYRIYFPDESSFRDYLRRQQRQQQQSQSQQQSHSESEARELIKKARSIVEGY